MSRAPVLSPVEGPRCLHCGGGAGPGIVLLKLRRGSLCSLCVEKLVGNLRAHGVDLTVFCPLCPRKYGKDDEPRAEAEDA